MILPLLLLAAPVAAQTLPPPADPVPDILQLGTDNERMTVPVQIAGAGPYRFVIDTGAQRTVISRELAGTLGLAPGRDVMMTAMSGRARQGTVLIPSIQVSNIGGGAIEAPALATVDLGAPGMLGVDTLQGHQVSIDFDRHRMEIRPSVKRRRRDDALPGEIVVRAKSLFGQLVVTDAEVDGVRVRIILDTGSVVSIGNQALRRRFARRVAGTDTVPLVSVTGATMIADHDRLGDVRLGGVTIRGLPVAYYDAAPFKAFNLENTPAIMLGMDALEAFRRVQIDFANREVRFALPRAATATTGFVDRAG